MFKPVKIFFVPEWLDRVLKAEGRTYQELKSILSTRDLKVHTSAQIYLAKVIRNDYGLRGADTSIEFPVEPGLEVSQSEDDVLSGIFGPAYVGKTFADVHKLHFELVPMSMGEYALKIGDGSRDLATDLLDVIANECGHTAAFGSELFRRYLSRGIAA